MSSYEKFAYPAWNILIKYAEKKRTVTYDELATAISSDLHFRQVGKVLDPIQNYCIEENLPPLTILVVRMSDRKPGSGFIACTKEEFDLETKKVFSFNWSAFDNPFAYTTHGKTLASLKEDLKINPNRALEIYATIKTRGNSQILFRQLIREIYNNKCAFCGFSVPDALEAVHIKPWNKSMDDEKLDLKNGILLCSTHHKLFDSKILSINNNYEVVCLKTDFEDNAYNNYLIRNLIGKKIKIPDLNQYKPSLEYLEFHRNQI